MRYKAWLVIFSAVILSAAVFFFFGQTGFGGLAADQETVSPKTAKIERPLVTFVDPSLGPAAAPNLVVM